MPNSDNQNLSTCNDTPQKWRQHLLLELPHPKPDCIWIHACSFGEVASILPLASALHQQGYLLHITVITHTGMQHAQKHLQKIASISYLPWDLPTFMRRFVRKLQPSLLLLAETEFWPGMLKACKREGVNVVGINTRISDRSFPKYHASRILWQRWLSPIQLFLPQSVQDAERLQAIGIAPERIHVAGNLKYAVSPPKVDAESLRKRLDPTLLRPILLLASTHHDEESRLLEMWTRWHQVRPDLLTLIVPRHPERFNLVAEIIQQQGLRLSRWSDTDIMPNSDVILIDAMGILQSLYTIADIAFIGGSLVNIGGHNPIEAAVCGRGVITGAHTQNFKEIMQHMQKHHVAVVTQSDHELATCITRFLQHPEDLQNLHANTALYMQDKSQALTNVLQYIKPYLPPLTCD